MSKLPLDLIAQSMDQANARRILVVEDEVIVAYDLEQRLLEMGYAVAGLAFGGEEALALAGRLKPDLVLMDIHLRGHDDGITTAIRIRQQFQVPILFLTAYAEEILLQQAKRAQPYGYILKPFQSQELRSAIEIALDKHQAELEIMRLNRLYAALSQINQMITRIEERETLFQQACRLLVQFGGFKGAAILRKQETREDLIPISWFTEGIEEVTVTAADFESADRAGNSPTALRSGKTVLWESPALNGPAKSLPADAWELEKHISASVPLKVRESVWGVLWVQAKDQTAFQEKEVQLLEEVALDIAFALEHLEEEAARRQAEEALRQKEENLRKLFASMNELVVLHELIRDAAGQAVDYRILDCNQAFTRVTGIARDRALGALASQLYGTGAAPFLSVYAAVATSGTPAQFETFYAPMGKHFHISVFSPAPNQFATVASDITAIHHAENALKSSEERYRRLFEEATEGIALAEVDTGTLVDCNQAFLQLTGYEKAELIGKPQSILHPPEPGHPSVTHTFHLHRSEQEGHILEAQLVTKQGCLRTVEIKGRKIVIGGCGLVQAFFRDITDTQRYQHERETTLTLLRMLNNPTSTDELLDRITGWLREWTGCEAVGVRLRQGEDFPYYVTHGFPPQFVMAEKSLCSQDASGQVRRDTCGNVVLECMCGNVLRKQFNPALPFFTAQGSFWTNSTSELLASTTEADRLARTRNRCHGEGYESVALIPLRCGGECFGLLQLNDHRRGRFDRELIAFLESIADQLAIALAQRQSQTALHRNETELSALYTHAPLMMCLVDQQHRICRINRAVLENCKKAEQELIGLRVGELLGCIYSLDDPRGCGSGPNCLICPLHLAVMDSLRTGQSHRRVEVNKVILQQGKRVKLSLLASVARVEVEEQSMVLVCLEDITPLREVETQYLHAQKMEAIGQLAGGIAHDFNNILAAILMNLSLLKMDCDLNSSNSETVEELEKEAKRAADLTRQLLVFSRRQVIQKQVLNLNEHLRQTLVMIRRLLGETIEINFQPGPSLCWIEADPGMVDQVIMNLCVNARDAMPRGGVISIATREVDFHPQTLSNHPAARVGRFACLQIADTGCGMDEETLQRIFEPFFTTKVAGKGTGLGLATVYGIVKQHGGWIEVESQAGKGTCFQVFWPPCTLQVNLLSTRRKEAAPHGGGETILVVEDEEALRGAISKLLHYAGYRVVEARNGSEGLRQWEKHRHEISLLLTDMVMPGGMSGLELAQYLRQSKPDLKIIIMSGYSPEISCSTEQLAAEGVRFVGKPLDGLSLTQAVHQSLR